MICNLILSLEDITIKATLRDGVAVFFLKGETLMKIFIVSRRRGKEVITPVVFKTRKEAENFVHESVSCLNALRYASDEELNAGTNEKLYFHEEESENIEHLMDFILFDEDHFGYSLSALTLPDNILDRGIIHCKYCGHYEKCTNLCVRDSQAKVFRDPEWFCGSARAIEGNENPKLTAYQAEKIQSLSDTINYLDGTTDDKSGLADHLMELIGDLKEMWGVSE